MQVSIGISKTDQSVEVIAERLNDPLRRLSESLSREYGEGIDNLWIDIEISPLHEDVQPEPWPFRFQEKVNPLRGSLSASTPMFNVAHYSVRPNLRDVPLEGALSKVLQDILDSTEVLAKKSSKFPNFRIAEFREDLAREISRTLSA